MTRRARGKITVKQGTRRSERALASCLLMPVFALLCFLLPSAGRAEEVFRQYLEPGFCEDLGNWAFMQHQRKPESMHFNSKGRTNKQAVYRLGRVIPPGRYRVFVQMYQPHIYKCKPEQVVPFTVTLNDASVALPYPELDKDKVVEHRYSFREFPEIVTTRPGDELKIGVGQNEHNAREGQGFNFTGIFVTGDPRDRLQLGVHGNAVKIFGVEDREDESKSRARSGRNLVPNGGFEVGYGGGWRYQQPVNSGLAFNHESWMHGKAAQGRACAVLRPGTGILTDALKTSEGPHTLSLFARGSGKIQFRVLDADPYTGKGEGASKSFDLTDQWQRFSQAVTLKAKKYAVSVSNLNTSEAIYFDGVQLEKGNQTEFAAAEPVEMGIFFDQLGKCFLHGEKVAPQIIVSSPGKGRSSLAVWWRVVDYFDDTIRKGDLAVPLQEGWGRETLTLERMPPGMFRIEVGLKGSAEMLEESVFTVHLDPQEARRRGPAFFWTYCTLGEHCSPVMKKAGLDWAMAFSACQLSHWHVVEAEAKGKFRWFDKEVEHAVKAGLDISADIDWRIGDPTKVQPRWLKLAPRSATVKTRPENLRDWYDFVFNLVDHYKKDIHSWIILDDIDHYFTTEDYLELVKTAHAAAKKADPSARLTVWSYTRTKFTPEENRRVLDELNRYADAFHQDTMGMARAYGKPMWGYEFSGMQGLYRRHTSVKELTGGEADHLHYRRVNADRIKRTVGLIAERNATGFGHYDGRLPPSHMSIFEWDGGLNTGGTTLAAMNHFLRGTRYGGKLDRTTRVTAHAFDGAGRKLIVAWSMLGDALRMPPPPRGKVGVYDLVGKAIGDGEEFLLTADPVYLEADGASVNAAVTYLQAAVPQPVEPFRWGLLPGPDPNTLQLGLRVVNAGRVGQTARMNLDPGSLQYLVTNLDFRREATLRPGEAQVWLFPFRYQAHKPLARSVSLALALGEEKYTQAMEIDALYSQAFAGDNVLSYTPLPQEQEGPRHTVHGGRSAGREVIGCGRGRGGPASAIGRIKTRGGAFTRDRKTGSPRPLARDCRRATRKSCYLTGATGDEAYKRAGNATRCKGPESPLLVAARDDQTDGVGPAGSQYRRIAGHGVTSDSLVAMDLAAERPRQWAALHRRREGGPAAIPANQRVGDLTSSRNLLDSPVLVGSGYPRLGNGCQADRRPDMPASTLPAGRRTRWGILDWGDCSPLAAGICYRTIGKTLGTRPA